MKFYTIQEAQKILRVGTNVMLDLIHKEGLPVIQISPRKRLIEQEQLENWLNERKVNKQITVIKMDKHAAFAQKIR